MSMKKFTALALAAGSLFSATAPAQAMVTTFAEYSAVGTAANLRWLNNGTSSTNGTGGSLFSISSQTSTVIGSRTVDFSFLQASIAPFATNLAATFTFSATAPSGNPAQLLGSFLLQPGLAGSFSFLTQTGLTVGSNFFAAGSNLLSGTFGGGTIFGQRGGTSGGVSASTLGGSTISYSSDFLSFAPGSNLDFAISLTSIASVLQATPTTGVPTRALRSFRAVSGGSFSADPAPIVTAIPEPAVWGLMIVGFGMVGLQTRRRARNAAVAA